MKFEETIQNCFDNCPELFQVRWQVLDHLFFTLGNGYQWINGQLVEVSNGVKSPVEKLKANLGTDGKAVQHNIIDEETPIGMSLYDDGKYPIEIPEDVQPDWFAGYKEAMELIDKQDTFENAGMSKLMYETTEAINNKTPLSPEVAQKLLRIWEEIDELEE